MNNSLYLEHHGILGQKWGFRRNRNKGKRYRYNTSFQYHAADPNTRARMDHMHAINASKFGEKKANKIDYAYIEKGKKLSSAMRKEKFKHTISSHKGAILLGTAILTAPSLLSKSIKNEVKFQYR